jgi:uncharacterized protein YbaA (DUF1428 family)
MAYVDGFIVPVPKKNLAAYRRISQKAGRSGANMAPSSTGSVWATISR